MAGANKDKAKGQFDVESEDLSFLEGEGGETITLGKKDIV